MKILKTETNKNVREQGNVTENEPTEFFIPMRSLRICSTLNDDTNKSRNSVYEKDCLKNQPKQLVDQINIPNLLVYH